MYNSRRESRFIHCERIHCLVNTDKERKDISSRHYTTSALRSMGIKHDAILMRLLNGFDDTLTSIQMCSFGAEKHTSRTPN